MYLRESELVVALPTASCWQWLLVWLFPGVIAVLSVPAAWGWPARPDEMMACPETSPADVAATWNGCPATSPLRPRPGLEHAPRGEHEQRQAGNSAPAADR